MKLSIITINYNNKNGLDKTIASVLNQTVNDFEYIVIDGGSKDGSLEIIKKYQENLTYWVSEPDNGIYHAMNKGVKQARNDYCLFLNSGDVLHDNTVISKIEQIDGNDDFIIGKVLFLNTLECSSVEEPLSMLKFYNSSIPHPATFIKRHWLIKYPYDETLKIVSDWKFFLQCLILCNASCKLLDLIVTDFDTTGISACNKAKVENERSLVLKELIPNRILIDYLKFVNGNGYEQSIYDSFFITLRDYNYKGLIYTCSVLFVRFISLFKKTSRVFRNFPLSLPKHNGE